MPSHTKSERSKPFSNVSKRKARKILEDDSVKGKKLTRKQKGALGARAGGK